ncbi:L,D-transpeptidase family protein [Fuscibacter oryzae]|uniref:L,D-transpeptidase family protein n=1 Tax=Fuscibacter oryzae TaxID=2803939 RepID=A0A8J7MUU3_9RHOB|nr:L,D-transpeptidase family protein [Fuscibacter oryzae]MBL4928319.1 L,D-transpeptidase family protein [Fuscibacter oryzae]
MKWLARFFTALILLSLMALGLAALYLRPSDPLPTQPPLVGVVERIVVEKSARRLVLYQNGVIVREYRVALGFQPQGTKVRQGDGRTPEGLYRINRRNAASAYHLSLGLDYPHPTDIARARAGGYDPGGDIMIHGQPNALPDMAKVAGDWTAGCIALTNAEMREIWAVTPTGTPVEVRP